MSASIRIDPLDGTNYNSWKIHMRSILKKKKLWKYVTGDIPMPETTTSDASTVKKWKEADGQPEAEIMLAISPGELGRHEDARRK